MESKGYIPPEAEHFIANPSTEEAKEAATADAVSLPESIKGPRETVTELSAGMTENTAPEILPIPSGPLRQQLKAMAFPENTQRALIARTHEFSEISSRITPELMMSVPGMGERSVTQALDTLESYGVRAKTPGENDAVNAIGLDHARNDRLKRQGVETVGQLVDLWNDPESRRKLDPTDAAIITHRLDRLALTHSPSP